MRKYDEQLMLAKNTPMFYRRYIDDGFGLWLYGEEALKDFHRYANYIHEDIKIELRYDRHQI